jgi:hypothetical protein
MIDKTVQQRINKIIKKGIKDTFQADDFHFLPRHCVKCGQRMKNSQKGDVHKICSPMKKNNTTYFSQHIKKHSGAYEYRITKANPYHRQGIE